MELGKQLKKEIRSGIAYIGTPNINDKVWGLISKKLAHKVKLKINIHIREIR